MSKSTRRTHSWSSKYAWIALSAFGGIALAYTALLWVKAPAELTEWINQLLATLLSVIAAFLVGTWLYVFQSKETDEKKRADLRALIQSEMAETITSFGRSITIPEDDESAEEPTLDIRFRYVQPLILEEAAKSGLFSRDATFMMLRLAKSMRTYNVKVDVALRPGPKTSTDIYFGMIKDSADEVVNGCRKMLKLLDH